MTKIINNLIISLNTSRKFKLEKIEADVTAQALANAIVNKYLLPSDIPPKDNFIILIHGETRKEIPSWVTLDEAKVIDGEELVLIFESKSHADKVNYPWHKGWEGGNLGFNPPKYWGRNYDVLRVEITLPYITTIEGFFGDVNKRVRAFDFIYSLFVLLSTQNVQMIDEYLILCEKRGKAKTEKNPENTEENFEKVEENFQKYFYPIHPRKFLKQQEIEPLRLMATKYGSDGSFDFLGIGKILELTRDAIKDYQWRGKHEKEKADLERKSLYLENQNKRLTLEKTSTEIQFQRMELQKQYIETAIRGLDFVQKIKEVELSGDQKELLLKILIKKLEIFDDPDITLLLQSENPTQFIPQNISKS